MPQFQTMHRPAAPSRLAVRFIFVSAGIYFGVLALAASLIYGFPPRPVPGAVVFPPVFWLTTALLAAGSGLLQRAVWSVRLERQKPFRRSLVTALVSGALFVAIQIYGLYGLLQNQEPDDVSTGANAFILIMGTLHAMHFSLALLFLVWVTLHALADRYDHEYSFGVTVCAWFWHGLGIAWMCVMVVLAIACVPGLFAVR